MANDSTRVETRTDPSIQIARSGAGRDSGALQHLWRSPWTLWVGFRYLKSKKNTRFLSFITLISFLGVGLGVMAMVIVLSVMDGFEAELKKRLMASELHVLIQPTSEVSGYQAGYVPKTALDPNQLLQLIPGRDKVVSFLPVVQAEAILKVGRNVAGVVVKGVSEERLARLKTQMVESAESQVMVERQGPETVRLPGLIMGQELAYNLGDRAGVLPGDQVTLISPTETEGPLSSVPRLKRYVIEGIYNSGIAEQELHTVFATEAAVRSFIRRADVVSQWEVTVKDFEQAPEIANELRGHLPGFKVQDWVQLNTHLFFSLRLERIAMFVALSFIVVVASFNIVTTLSLMVLEKKKEISILKAMGARHGQVAAIFLAEGLLIGGVGVAVGTILGLTSCLILRRYKFIELPDVFYDRTLPVTFNASYYVGVAVCALIIVLIACVYPSRRAAELDPLTGIRFG